MVVHAFDPQHFQNRGRLISEFKGQPGQSKFQDNQGYTGKTKTKTNSKKQTSQQATTKNVDPQSIQSHYKRKHIVSEV